MVRCYRQQRQEQLRGIRRKCAFQRNEKTEKKKRIAVFTIEQNYHQLISFVCFRAIVRATIFVASTESDKFDTTNNNSNLEGRCRTDDSGKQVCSEMSDKIVFIGGGIK